MPDPTNGDTPGNGDSQKSWKSLPTDRVGFDRQLEVLRAYGAIAADEGKTGAEVAKAVGIHAASVSVCNPFFTESGLIERSGVGNKASADVAAYHRAMGWEASTAGEKLAPTLRNTWFWKAIAPRLSLKPMEEADALKVLAEACGAGKKYRGQLALILDYAATGGLVIRDGSVIRQGPQANPGVEPVSPPKPKVDEAAPQGEVQPPPPPRTQAKGQLISFDVSIQLNHEDIAGWSPDQIKEFFNGVALVIGARKQAP